MSKKFKICLILTVMLLQLAILSHFTPFSVVPNYTFVVVLAIAIISPESESVVIGGVAGFLMDLFSGAPLGLNTLIYIYMIIGCIIVSEAVFSKNGVLMSIVCFGFSFLFELLFGIFSCLLRGASFGFDAIGSIVLPTAAINAAIFFPVYVILRRIRFEKRRKGIKYER